jgi:hypothetical protein
MALPSPNQGYQLKAETIQYQDATFRESVGNLISSAITQAQINLFTKSPILKMLGGGALAERADLKRRERFLATGRDPNTGRKLTKEELEERRKRAKDLGALAEIREILQGTLLDWKGKYDAIPVTMVPSRLPISAERQKMVTPSEEGGYSLADEERDAEKEREDDQDQLESEKRQQGFFSKLFGKKDEDGKGGSLLSSLMGMLTPLLGLFKGGISGMLGKIIGPLMSLLGSGASFIISGIGTVLSSLAPFIGTILLPLLLAGAAGLAIKGFIDRWADERERQGKFAAGRGMARAYAVEDKEGKKRFATAEELGTTEEEIAKAAREGKQVTTSTGETLISATPVTLQTLEGIGGKRILTDTPAPGVKFTAEQKELLDKVRSSNPFRKKYPGFFDVRGETKKEYPDWVIQGLQELDAQMAQHDGNIGSWSRSGDAGVEELTKSRDSLMENMKSFVARLDAQKDKRLKSTGKAVLEDISNQYRSVAPLYSLKDGFDSDMTRDWLYTNAVFGGYYNERPKEFLSNEDMRTWLALSKKKSNFNPSAGNFEMGDRPDFAEPLGTSPVQSTGPEIINTTMKAVVTPPLPEGTGMLKSASDLEAAKSQPPAMPSVSSNVNTVQTNNSANVMSAPSAQRRTGADMSPFFNFFPWQSAVYR